METLSFSVEGKFITNLAREKFYQNHDLGGAIKILMSCLECDELTEEQRLMLAFKILNGNAEIVGTYPNDDYGVRDINDEDNSFGLIEEIDNMPKTIKKLEHEAHTNLQKFLSVLDFLDLSEYELKDLNDKYYDEYGTALFPDLYDNRYSDTYLQAIDKFNQSDPIKSYMTRMKNTKDDDYGWLAPDGTYYPVAWGNHSKWAKDYLDANYPFKDNASLYWRTKPDGSREHLVNGDCLVYKLHWVLLDNPYQGIAHYTYDPTYGLTKAQKEFLYDYYIERNLNDLANKVWDDE